MLSVIQTIWATALPQIQDMARLALSWQAVNGAIKPELHVVNGANWTTASLPLDARAISLGSIEHSFQNRNRGTITLGTGSGDSDRTPLLGLGGEGAPLPGTPLSSMEQSGTIWFGRNGFIGNSASYARQGDLLFLSDRIGGGGIETWDMRGAKPLLLSQIGSSGNPGLSHLSAMTTLHSGGKDWLVAASQSHDQLHVMRIEAGGRLVPTAVIGTKEKLPIDLPSQLGHVVLNGQDYLLLGAFGSSSVTVLRMGANGALTYTDQLIDNQHSRFGGLAAMDILKLGNQVLVALAGKDGGVSLAQLLPNGRLTLLATLEDSLSHALMQIVDLQFVVVGNRIELFALAAGDRGLTRILLDPSRFGPDQTSSARGSEGHDVLIAPSAGGLLRGLGGDDILISGAGRDQLQGGAGADIFMLLPDKIGRDSISDFDPAADRIDLSGFAMLRSFAALRVQTTKSGALIRFGTHEITVTTGEPLSAADLQGAVLFHNDRLILSSAPTSSLPPSGAPAGAFLWRAGPAEFSGVSSRQDHLSYAKAPTGLVVDLQDQSRNAGAALGHRMRSIEEITGSAFNDQIYGDAQANRIWGGAGNDRIEARGGNDWIAPGLGRDTIDGGAGSDMLSYADVTRAANINLTTGQAIFGKQISKISGFESVTGTVLGDVLTGDARANQLRGMGGNDWINATPGADRIDGGTGIDMISYSGSIGRVVVDLALQRGSEGWATGQTYAGIENVTGSIYGDLLIGNAGHNLLRGLGDYDWFIGSGGNDSYEGGSGRDTVAYANATTGITADLTLQRGLTGQARGDRYKDIEALTGTSYQDRLIGDQEINVLRGLGGDDFIYGGAGFDRIEGGGGNDTIYGGIGNDRIEGGKGRDFLHGGGGYDTAIYIGKRADFQIRTLKSDVTLVTDSVGSEGADRLVDIEVLQFSDGQIWL